MNFYAEQAFYRQFIEVKLGFVAFFDVFLAASGKLKIRNYVFFAQNQ